MNQEWPVLTTRGRLLIAAESQQHAENLARSDGYELDVRFAPFTEYESDTSRIIGSIEQGGSFIHLGNGYALPSSFEGHD